MQKAELYFHIPNDVGVMKKLVQAVPTAWGVHGWADIEMERPGYDRPVRRYEMGCREAQPYIVWLLECWYRGRVQFVSGPVGTARHKNPAVCEIRFAPWMGTSGPEMGERLPRIRLSWHMFVKNNKPGGYDPVVDTEGSGRYEDVAPIAELCRVLGLEEYEVPRASDCMSKPSGQVTAFAIAAE